MWNTFRIATLHLLPVMLILALPIASPVYSEDTPTNSQLEEELRKTEIAFAATMKDRDLDAFSGFLADEVVFFTGQDVMRGKKTVAEGWASYFEGENALFAWEPEAVSVLESGELGFSSGPVLDPEGKRVGTFNSVWRRVARGEWKIVFDRGCPPCECPQE